MLYLLAIALCIGADQAVKYYVVTHLELYESAPLLPGVVELSTSGTPAAASPSWLAIPGS